MVELKRAFDLEQYGSSVLGRVRERQHVGKFLSAADTDERGLILEGEIGIGKSTLLEWACEQASAAGYIVLTADLVDLELPREYDCIAQLLGKVGPEPLQELAEPHRRVIYDAVLGDLSGFPVDGRTVATAVLTICRALTSKGPLLLSIDDLPYMDISSQRVLSSVMRRAGDMPIKLLTTLRTHWDHEVPGSVAEHFGDRLRRLAIGPMGSRELRQLIRERTHADLSGRSMARVHDLSAGNPLFALELVRAESEVPSADTVRPSFTLNSLTNMVRERVAVLSAGARDVLLVAALVRDPTYALLLEAAADPRTALRSLDEAKDNLLIVQEASALRFGHPLIRSVVVSSATARDRRAVHQRLAGIVQSQEDRARHLALGADGADGDIAQEVEEAARAALSRGAPEAAAALAALATMLTPPGCEGDRTRRVRLEAESRFDARELDDACSLLDEEITKLGPGPVRAQLLRQWARSAALRGDPLGPCLERLFEALAEVGEDQAGRAEIAFDLAGMAANAGQVDVAKRFAVEATELAESIGDDAMAAQIASADAFFRFSLGEGAPVDLARIARSGDQGHGRVSAERRPGLMTAHILHLSDELAPARHLYRAERATAIAEGMESDLPLVLWGLVETEIWAGEWRDARTTLLEAWDVTEDAAETPGRIVLGGLKGLLGVLEGAIDEGLREAQTAIQLAMDSGFSLGVLIGAQALGLGGISRNDPEETRAMLAPIIEQVLALGLPEPGLCHFVADDVEARIRLNDLDGAEKELELLEHRSVALHRLWGLAVAGRCRGLLCMAQGESEKASEAIDSALEHHQRLSMPFELARTLTVAGEIHRRARRKRRATDALDAAEAIFDRLGAPVWREHAAEERSRVGVRTATSRASSSLTEAEIEVAGLAIKGLSNAEIAGRLFMSQRTVQAHLSKIYRKVGVRTRTQLAARFRSEQGKARP